MHAYLPVDYGSLIILISMLLLTLGFGYVLVLRFKGQGTRLISWLWVWASFFIVLFVFDTEPPGLRMLAIIAMLLTSMKVMMHAEHTAAGKALLGIQEWMIFATLWLGMNPQKFAQKAKHPLSKVAVYLKYGARNVVIGIVLLLLAQLYYYRTDEEIVTTVLSLAGIGMIVHLGMIQLTVGMWRQAGYKATPLFRNPLGSDTLGEFWGRRWNLGFMEMMTLAVVRPMHAGFGANAATFSCFLLSGIFHDMAISVPARAGYGLPTAYFALQGILVLLEQHLAVLKQLLNNRVFARLWTLFWVLVPMPILFHPAFIQEIVWPLILHEY